jgi:hypothetical protein
MIHFASQNLLVSNNVSKVFSSTTIIFLAIISLSLTSRENTLFVLPKVKRLLATG